MLEAVKNLEIKVVRTEAYVNCIQEDIKEIKLHIKWVIGLIFGLNSTIIGILLKGFNIV